MAKGLWNGWKIIIHQPPDIDKVPSLPNSGRTTCVGRWRRRIFDGVSPAQCAVDHDHSLRLLTLL
jgi:hypothetical protein